MNASSLLMGSHTPPADWDGSPWWCDHCKQVVYTDPDHYLEIVIEFRALQKRASDGDKIAQARLRSRMSAHAAVHLDALLLAPMSIRVGTDFFIVDPMHAFELNVVKTAFKYSFGDRMDEEQRTDVAGYLDEIDLPLDIRVKGKRNPEQKWFTASAVDDFFLGCDEGARKVPALSDNIWEIVQRVFPRPTDSPAEASPDDPPPPAPPTHPPKPRPAPGGVGSVLRPWEGSAMQQSLLHNAPTRTGAHKGALLPAPPISTPRCADSQGLQTWTYQLWFGFCVHVSVHAHLR